MGPAADDNVSDPDLTAPTNADQPLSPPAGTSERSPQPVRLQGNHYPLWTPRFWNGMTTGDYLRLLWRGRLRISPSRWHMAVIILLTSICNSLLGLIQYVCYQRRIHQCKITQPPLFVIGHFRTGTTLLFEHLACDDQFTYPTTYECFSPRHFLVTENLMPLLLSWMLPKKRPMDNMRAGFDRPQEDEFALLSLSAPTIYQRLAFPNQPAPYLESLTFTDEQSPLLRRWQKQLVWFYQAVTLRKGKRLLIKSPVHTGRIARLIKLFPGAKFVHIVRNPQEVFPSIRNAWRVLELTQGFQAPRNDDQFDQIILNTLRQMYEGFWQQSASLHEGQLCEVKYEELVADPLNQLRRIYEQLELGDFAALQPALEKRIAEFGDYQTNKFESDPSVQNMVNEYWFEYASRYGYDC